MKKYQKINTAKTQNHMQTHSIQHLQIKRGMWITGKKQKQRQVVAASSWPVAHRDALGTHTCHWSKFSLLVFKTALLQMADIINFCTCIWWEPPAGLPCFCTAEPTPVLSLLTYLLCFSPQTFCFRLASHKWGALVAIACFWNVRLEGNRKTISRFHTIQ